MKKFNKEFKCDIIEIIDVLSESEKNNWSKVLMKVSYNDNAPVLDIRNIDMESINSNKIIMGKGVTLTDEEAEKLTNALMNEGYLDEDDAEEYFNNRDNIFKQKKKSKNHKVIIKRLEDDEDDE